ncbi:MAG TPA: hypothetical protein VNQ74_10590, partial [Burkholderiaceae bacterium]|nr:hypothetical protein [Burkholderiaceae bacterium]
MAAGEQTTCRHFVFRQRACFVRANNRGAAQGLDGGQATHECVAANHSFHAECERDRNYSRKGFWHDRNCQSHAEDYHFDKRLTSKQTEDHDDYDHRECSTRERLADAV